VANRSATPELAETLPAEGAFAVATGLMRPRSRGRMRLTGAEPDAPLHLDPAFLADPSDRKRLSEAIATVLDLARQPSLAALTDGPIAPAPGDDRDAFLTRACATFFHPCGTARMGSDEGAVCDPRLAVRGARGLWIADASVIPEIPSCHTHSTATLIGERAADFILEAT
jgi:choline dehydrogenase